MELHYDNWEENIVEKWENGEDSIFFFFLFPNFFTQAFFLQGITI